MHRSRVVMFPVLSLTMLCLAMNGSGAAKPTAADLRITDQIEGWTEIDSEYTEYEGEGLYALINGYAQVDVENGLVEGIYQELKPGDDLRFLALLVEDFGTEDKAAKNMADKIENLPETSPLPGFDESQVAAAEYLISATVHATFGRFYISLGFGEFPSGAEALEEAIAFLVYYRSKILVPATEDLRITNEVAGWDEESGSYAAFDVQGLHRIINGGAVPHVDNGLVEGHYQVLEESGGQKKAEVFVEDFGCRANAATMFDYSAQNSVSQEVTIEGFEKSEVIASEHLSGITAYAHFDRFYISVNLTGYSDAEQARSDAAGILGAYRDMLPWTTGAGLSVVGRNDTQARRLVLKVAGQNPVHLAPSGKRIGAQLEVRITDLRGRLVRSLSAAPQQRGATLVVDWDGRDARGKTVSAGTYVTTLVSRGRRLGLSGLTMAR